MAVYILHIDPPYQHAKHYIGYTVRPIKERVEVIELGNVTSNERRKRHGGVLVVSVTVLNQNQIYQSLNVSAKMDGATNQRSGI
jgi:hypothetical protein